MDPIRTHLRPYRWQFLAAVLCVAAESVCDLLGPTLMAHIINQGIEVGSLPEVYHWGKLMLLVVACGALFAIGRNSIAGIVSQGFGADLRHPLFSKILHLSMASSDHLESGSLITRMGNDVTQLTHAVNGTMRIFIKAPVTCIGSIVLATMLSPRLSIAIYGVLIIVFLILFLTMKLSYPLFRTLQKAMDTLNTRIEEFLLGVSLVKALGTEKYEERKFAEDNDRLMKQSIRSQMLVTLATPLITFTVSLGTAGVLLIGNKLFTLSSIDIGNVSAFTVYMAQILSSILMLTNIFNILIRTKASKERISEVLEAKEEKQDGEEWQTLPGTISFSDVTFSYPEGSGVPALSHVSFSLEEGGSLAIIGPTGSGKSTIAWLLLHLYPVDSGEITIGGESLESLSNDTLRHAVTLVPQQASLFSGTIRENLLWGNRDASEEEMKEALRVASADFVTDLDEPATLSGGQKQRIAIARALLRKAPILVLDDATSALDAVTEAKVRKALFLLNPKPTLVMITQRCSTAMSADHIMVLENGKVEGIGSNKELLEKSEVYHAIFESQLGGIIHG
jgi:ATP-binding cassette subfamily B multidrug efflux pump